MCFHLFLNYKYSKEYNADTYDCTHKHIHALVRTINLMSIEK